MHDTLESVEFVVSDGADFEVAPARLGPKQIPQNLPDSRKHPTVLVTGLGAWFAKLTSEYRRVFLRYLFAFNPDQQSPSAGLYRQPLATVRLIACYDMSPSDARDWFVSLVRWTGVEDDPRVPEAAHPASEPGFCYLALVGDHARPAMQHCLGPNPWAAAVAAYLLADPGSWSSLRFQYTVGGSPPEGGNPGYQQGHVSEVDRGLKVRDLVSLFSGWVRVGAATGDVLAMRSHGLETHASNVPTLFDDKPKAPTMTLTYGVFAKVTVGHGLVWTPFRTPALVVILGTYESVRLVSADFSLSLPSGANNVGYAAITRTGASLTGEEWFGAPYLKMIPGSDQGSVVGTYSLPAVHTFNPELRASVVGNGPAQFMFSLAGDAGGQMIITGSFKVEVAGQALLGSFDMSGGLKVKSNVRSVQRSLAYSVEAVDAAPPGAGHDDGASDDDSDG